MLALRQQMGWPLCKPANDCLAFGSGRTSDFEVGMELGRIAQMLGKDIIYSSWASVGAMPSSVLERRVRLSRQLLSKTSGAGPLFARHFGKAGDFAGSEARQDLFEALVRAQ